MHAAWSEVEVKVPQQRGIIRSTQRRNGTDVTIKTHAVNQGHDRVYSQTPICSRIKTWDGSKRRKLGV